MDLNKEAESYLDRNYNLSYEITTWQKLHIKSFIAGANSEYVQAKILKAQINVLKRTGSERWTDILEELKQQLKELEDE
jgi:hypothetical protein